MRTVVLFLPALICVGGMALCVRLMSRSHGGTSHPGPGPTRLGESEIGDLRGELDRLRGEVASRDARAASQSLPTVTAQPQAQSRK
jgi:hypothetical protein